MLKFSDVILNLSILHCSSVSFALCVLKLCLGTQISIVIFSRRVYPKESVKKITLCVCLLEWVHIYCSLR